MKCPKCNGRKFTELEHGLIMVECDKCNGTGEVEEEAPLNESIELPKTIEEASKIVKNAAGRRPDFPSGKDFVDEVRGHNDSSIGTERDNQLVGSTDTGKPKRTRKPKTQKKARKGTS